MKLSALFLVAVVLTVLLFASSPAARAGDHIAVRVDSPDIALPGLARLRGAWHRFTAFFFAAMSSRERVIQFSAVGVALGLYIMLRRMPGQT